MDGTQHPLEHRLQQVDHPGADAGDIHPEVGHVEFLGDALDLLRLVLEVQAAPVVALQNAEPLTGGHGRGDHHQGGVVAGTTRVIAEPHLPQPKRARRAALVVPPAAGIDPGPLHVLKLEHRQGIVDELAHEQPIEGLAGVFILKLLHIDEVAPHADGILQGDDVAPLPIRADLAALPQRLLLGKLDGLALG
ncbi:hypothetical protein D3C78_1416440 [compost metagenome]